MSAFQVHCAAGGVATLTFNLAGEKVNKLSIAAMTELEGHLDTLKREGAVRLLLIRSGKPDMFIAGADINSFEDTFNSPGATEEMMRYGHAVFNKLEALPFPTVAVIDGACLGGGCELALACSHRIATDNPKANIGVPEVSLGIFPGWGGTQRLPRLVGLQQALNLILTGKPIDSKKAFKIGLVDALVPKEFLDDKLNAAADSVIAAGKGKRGWLAWLLEGNPLGRAILFWQAKRAVLAKTKGQYPAPLVALDLIRRTFTMPLKRGLEEEIRTFVAALEGPFHVARNLIHVYFANEKLKKNPGIPDGVVPRPIKSAAVLGAGTMGSGITWLFCDKGISVRMKDVKWECVGKGLFAIREIYNTLMRIRKIKMEQVRLRMQRIGGSVDYAGFKHVDFVVEAAVEDVKLKEKILAEVEEKVAEGVVIGSNTSSLTIAEIGKGMKHPDRLVGMHFFNPANRMPLVEVIAGERSAPQAVADAVGVCRTLGKIPIVVGDCPGFLVNRIFVLAANEVMWLLQEGASMRRIERAMEAFGLPMSPFALCDEVGNDVNYHVVRSLQEAYGARMEVPKIVRQMYERGLLGKKVGKGYYVYKGKKRPNPEVDLLLAGNEKVSAHILEEEIIQRVVIVMVNEAARCLEERIISVPVLLDMALILGVGFPPFRGGLLWYADTIGISTIVDALQARQEERFTPAPLLLSMARDHKTFFSH